MRNYLIKVIDELVREVPGTRFGASLVHKDFVCYISIPDKRWGYTCIGSCQNRSLVQAMFGAYAQARHYLDNPPVPEKPKGQLELMFE